jgi:hypothetical protein
VGRNLFALDHIVKDFSFENFWWFHNHIKAYIIQNDVLASYKEYPIRVTSPSVTTKVSVFEKPWLTPKKHH